jgi:predicted N-formylglutamate amidohydrolase
MKLLKLFNRKVNRDAFLQFTNNKYAKNNLFRDLTYKEKQAVELYDFRDISTEDPNNNVMITCEHASNKMHKIRPPKSQEGFLNTHWGYDIGAKDMAMQVSEKANILSIYANYSRLIIDPNRSLINETLVRKNVEKNIELEWNKEENLNL